MSAPLTRRISISSVFALVGLASLAAMSGCGSSKADPFAAQTNGGTAGTNGSGVTGTTVGGSGGSIATTGSIIDFDAATAGGGDAAPSLDGACGGSKIDASLRAVDLLLVVDKSGSMADQPTGFSTNKWTGLKTSLAASLGQVQARLAIGLEMFPYGTADAAPACLVPTGVDAVQVPVGAGTVTVPSILSQLDATTPGGGTPTAAALVQALDYFKNGAGAALVGDKYVLLATDGGPNCDPTNMCDDTRCTTNLDGQCPTGVNCCSGAAVQQYCLDDVKAVTAVSNLKNAGVKTIVVGIPGTESYATVLDNMADAGGAPRSASSPKYYAVPASGAAGGVDGLTTVLTSITKQLITSCSLQLTTQPPNLGLINVYVDNVLVPQAGPDGWEYANPATMPATVVLKGATCTRVETMGAETVAIQYGCMTRVN